MFDLIRTWCRKYFSDPQAGVLLIMLVLAILVLAFLGQIIAPLLAGLVLAYLLDSIIKPLHHGVKMPRWAAITVVYIVFIAVIVLFFLWFMPIFSKQFEQLIKALPQALHVFHGFVKTLPEKFPMISHKTVGDIISSTQFSPAKLAHVTQKVLSYSINSISSIMTWVVYVFLVPLLALFFLMDKGQLLKWMMSFAPKDRGLLVQVCEKMERQMGRYVRGKAFEVIIVWIATFILMRAFDLNYAVLLSFLVGVSVIIPYVGIVVVSVPVAVVAVLQFGMTSDLLYLAIIYIVIQMLDGFILVPVLYSEAVNLHPVAIIAAVVFFGGIWGFWGVFFAIPLATLVSALIYAWSSHAKMLEKQA